MQVNNFSYEIPDGLQDGDSIVIKGHLYGSYILFQLNSSSSTSDKNSVNLVPFRLMVNVSGNYEIEIIDLHGKDKICGVIPYGLGSGEDYEVLIITSSTEFKVILNSANLTSVKHMVELFEITHLNMIGEAEFHSIEFKDCSNLDENETNVYDEEMLERYMNEQVDAKQDGLKRVSVVERRASQLSSRSSTIIEVGKNSLVSAFSLEKDVTTNDDNLSLSSTLSIKSESIGSPQFFEIDESFKYSSISVEMQDDDTGWNDKSKLDSSMQAKFDGENVHSDKLDNKETSHEPKLKRDLDVFLNRNSFTDENNDEMYKKLFPKSQETEEKSRKRFKFPDVKDLESKRYGVYIDSSGTNSLASLRIEDSSDAEIDLQNRRVDLISVVHHMEESVQISTNKDCDDDEIDTVKPIVSSRVHLGAPTPKAKNEAEILFASDVLKPNKPPRNNLNSSENDNKLELSEAIGNMTNLVENRKIEKAEEINQLDKSNNDENDVFKPLSIKRVEFRLPSVPVEVPSNKDSFDGENNLVKPEVACQVRSSSQKSADDAQAAAANSENSPTMFSSSKIMDQQKNDFQTERSDLSNSSEITDDSKPASNLRLSVSEPNINVGTKSRHKKFKFHLPKFLGGGKSKRNSSASQNSTATQNGGLQQKSATSENLSTIGVEEMPSSKKKSKKSLHFKNIFSKSKHKVSKSDPNLHVNTSRADVADARPVSMDTPSTSFSENNNLLTKSKHNASKSEPNLHVSVHDKGDTQAVTVDTSRNINDTDKMKRNQEMDTVEEIAREIPTKYAEFTAENERIDVVNEDPDTKKTVKMNYTTKVSEYPRKSDEKGVIEEKKDAEQVDKLNDLKLEMRKVKDESDVIEEKKDAEQVDKLNDLKLEIHKVKDESGVIEEKKDAEQVDKLNDLKLEIRKVKGENMEDRNIGHVDLNTDVRLSPSQKIGRAQQENKYYVTTDVKDPIEIQFINQSEIKVDAEAVDSILGNDFDDEILLFNQKEEEEEVCLDQLVSANLKHLVSSVYETDSSPTEFEISIEDPPFVAHLEYPLSFGHRIIFRGTFKHNAQNVCIHLTNYKALNQTFEQNSSNEELCLTFNLMKRENHFEVKGHECIMGCWCSANTQYLSSLENILTTLQSQIDFAFQIVCDASGLKLQNVNGKKTLCSFPLAGSPNRFSYLALSGDAHFKFLEFPNDIMMPFYYPILNSLQKVENISFELSDISNHTQIRFALLRNFNSTEESAAIECLLELEQSRMNIGRRLKNGEWLDNKIYENLEVSNNLKKISINQLLQNQVEICLNERTVAKFTIQDSLDNITQLFINGEFKLYNLKVKPKETLRVVRLIQPLSTGQQIILNGCTYKKARRLSIALHCGSETELPDAKIGFCAVLLFEDDKSVRLELNSFLNRKWGQPIVSQNVKLFRGEEFEVRIINHIDGVELIIGDNKVSLSLAHQHAQEECLTHLVLDGDADIDDIQFPNELVQPYIALIPSNGLASIQHLNVEVSEVKDSSTFVHLSFLCGGYGNCVAMLVCEIDLVQRLATFVWKKDEVESPQTQKFHLIKLVSRLYSISFEFDKNHITLSLNNVNVASYSSAESLHSVTYISINGDVNLVNVNFVEKKSSPVYFPFCPSLCVML